MNLENTGACICGSNVIPFTPTQLWRPLHWQVRCRSLTRLSRDLMPL